MGVGSYFVFLLFYWFNLMICKVMFLFLFYTFQLIFNLCLENDSCNCTFFCLLITTINTNFVLRGYTVPIIFLQMVQTGKGDSSTPAPRHKQPRSHAHSQQPRASLRTKAPHKSPTRASAPPGLLIPLSDLRRPSLERQLPSSAKEESPAPRAWRRE